jgi:two-component system OmpR family sensor kinase
MKLGPLDVPSLPPLALPRLPLAAFRRRLVFHGAFVLLALATLALAGALLTEERQRGRERYEAGFHQRLSSIGTQLRHPTGQLALINANAPLLAEGDIAPVVLPFSALDFDDPFKARQAVEMSGCAVRWPDGRQLCVAVGSRAYAGGFLYLVADLDLPPAQPRERGQTDLLPVSRARVTLTVDGETHEWVAPFEAGRDAPVDAGRAGLRGRLTGFAGNGDTLGRLARPVRDFRGWLWQDADCADPSDALPGCLRRSLVSIRLPVEAWRAQLFNAQRALWPPTNLAATRVRLQWLTEDAPAAFDSAQPGALRPFALDQLTEALAPGERLRIERLRGAGPQPVTELTGQAPPGEVVAPWITRLMQRLPTLGDQVAPQRLTAQETVSTPVGRYRLNLSGDPTSADRHLGATATRMSWYVGAMLAAIALTWLLIEVGLMRRITLLTRRAAALRYNMQDPQVDRRLGELDVKDLGGKDELGILANTLATLLERVKEGVRREHIRAEQERDMWHAVGHEIMSPLQSLMVLHPDAQDPSRRYVQRMQQAVRVLYGTASPSEAISAAPLQLETLDLDAFLALVAGNAPHAGIADVVYQGTGAPVWVGADEHSLEDVVTHVLRNADRHRTPGTPVHLRLHTEDQLAIVSLANQGPTIDPALIDRIFEYGVSDPNATPSSERRGQGLYVARTYMAKMGGTILAFNTPDGVRFELRLPCKAGATGA